MVSAVVVGIEGAGEVVGTLKSNFWLKTGARAETGLEEGARAGAGLLPMSILACSGAVEMVGSLSRLSRPVA